MSANWNEKWNIDFPGKDDIGGMLLDDHTGGRQHDITKRQGDGGKRTGRG